MFRLGCLVCVMYFVQMYIYIDKEMYFIYYKCGCNCFYVFETAEFFTPAGIIINWTWTWMDDLPI